MKRMFVRILRKYYQRIRIRVFDSLSDNKLPLEGSPVKEQPVLFAGSGYIHFGNSVILGWEYSPYFFDGHSYIEARSPGAVVRFGNDIFCNNSLNIICAKTLIEIGDNVLIGYNVHIIDSDFHDLKPSKRLANTYKCDPVKIGKNVFIGSNVTILKGVVIGENSVVASGAVVTNSFPENVIIGGNPAKIIRKIDDL